MLFNSYIFIFLFLPICLAGYFALNHFNYKRAALGWLCFMSLVFYGYFNISYLPIIVVSILFNYLLSIFLNRYKGKKAAFILFLAGMLANIGVLVYFKYFDFFIQNTNYLFKTNISLLRLILPLGISFFTFQQMSYVIDLYSGTAIKYPFLSYSLYILFFPQLIAGPIILHDEAVPQFENSVNKRFNHENFSKGIMAFAFGLGKKVLVADVFGQIANWGFSGIGSLNTTTAVIVMLAYTMQIYFDFSGYCDMASGIALMFNIKLPINFNSPYRSLDIQDFWKRWHITLTRFFSYYLYIPLGGNRKGTARTYINILIVFLVSGFWHGANYTFIIWGLMHGLFSIFVRFKKPMIEKLHPALSWIITFAFVNIAWIMFRANSLREALSFYKRLLTMEFGAISIPVLPSAFPITSKVSELLSITGHSASNMMLALYMCFAIFACLQMKNTNERIDSFRPNIKTAIATVFILFMSIISLSGVSTFLYWNF